MNRKRSLEFLNTNQPLPADDRLEPTVLEEFEQVRVFFEQQPDHVAVEGKGGEFATGPVQLNCQEDEPGIRANVRSAWDELPDSVRFMSTMVLAALFFWIAWNQ